MEIIVQGKGVEYFAPNEVVLNINFNTKGLTYEEVLSEGTRNVQHFVNELLLKNGFQETGIIYVEDGTPRIAYEKVK